MRLNVLEKGKLVKSVICDKGSIKHISLGVDGDILLFIDDIKIVEEKINLMKKSLMLIKGDSSSLNIIPLYKKLSAEDCMFVVEAAKNYTGTGFIESLSNVFYSNNLDNWLSNKKHELMEVVE